MLTLSARTKNFDLKSIVSTPPALAGGVSTFQYFAKLGGVKNFENSWGGWLSWGGSKIAEGMNHCLCKTKYLDANFEKSIHFI